MGIPQLKRQAQQNLSIRKNKQFEKEGIPSDHAPKHGVPLQGRTVGISKGITRNMGDFESLRVDVWLTDHVEEGETQQEALERIEAIVDEMLENAVMSMVDD